MGSPAQPVVAAHGALVGDGSPQWRGLTSSGDRESSPAGDRGSWCACGGWQPPMVWAHRLGGRGVLPNWWCCVVLCRVVLCCVVLCCVVLCCSVLCCIVLCCVVLCCVVLCCVVLCCVVLCCVVSCCVVFCCGVHIRPPPDAPGCPPCDPDATSLPHQVPWPSLWPLAIIRPRFAETAAAPKDTTSPGVMHAKLMLLCFADRVRVAILSANLFQHQYTSVSQVAWVCDLPVAPDWLPGPVTYRVAEPDFPATAERVARASRFLWDLCDFVARLLDVPAAQHAGAGNPDAPQEADALRAAAAAAVCDGPQALAAFWRGQLWSRSRHTVPEGVHLVASVPGYHRGPDAQCYGHMRLRSLVRDVAKPDGWTVSYQCSSVGKVQPQWVADFERSVGLPPTGPARAAADASPGDDRQRGAKHGGAVLPDRVRGFPPDPAPTGNADPTPNHNSHPRPYPGPCTVHDPRQHASKASECIPSRQPLPSHKQAVRSEGVAGTERPTRGTACEPLPHPPPDARRGSGHDLDLAWDTTGDPNPSNQNQDHQRNPNPFAEGTAGLDGAVSRCHAPSLRIVWPSYLAAVGTPDVQGLRSMTIPREHLDADWFPHARFCHLQAPPSRAHCLCHSKVMVCHAAGDAPVSALLDPGSAPGPAPPFRPDCAGDPASQGPLPFAWLYAGSHNWSPAAWGQWVPGGPVLRIASWELGVLLVPPVQPPLSAGRDAATARAVRRGTGRSLSPDCPAPPPHTTAAPHASDGSRFGADPNLRPDPPLAPDPEPMPGDGGHAPGAAPDRDSASDGDSISSGSQLLFPSQSDPTQCEDAAVPSGVASPEARVAPAPPPLSPSRPPPPSGARGLPPKAPSHGLVPLPFTLPPRPYGPCPPAHARPALGLLGRIYSQCHCTGDGPWDVHEYRRHLYGGTAWQRHSWEDDPIAEANPDPDGPPGAGAPCALALPLQWEYLMDATATNAFRERHGPDAHATFLQERAPLPATVEYNRRVHRRPTLAYFCRGANSRAETELLLRSPGRVDALFGGIWCGDVAACAHAWHAAHFFGVARLPAALVLRSFRAAPAARLQGADAFADPDPWAVLEAAHGAATHAIAESQDERDARRDSRGLAHADRALRTAARARREFRLLLFDCDGTLRDRDACRLLPGVREFFAALHGPGTWPEHALEGPGAAAGGASPAAQPDAVLDLSPDAGSIPGSDAGPTRDPAPAPPRIAICTNQGGAGLRRWMETSGFGNPQQYQTEAQVEHGLTATAAALLDACAAPDIAPSCSEPDPCSLSSSATSHPHSRPLPSPPAVPPSGPALVVLVAYAFQSRKGHWAPVPRGAEARDARAPWPGSGGVQLRRSWQRAWRKPAPGMLREAMAMAAVGPADTLFVGDQPCDEAAAEAAGVRFEWAEDFFGRRRC